MRRIYRRRRRFVLLLLLLMLIFAAFCFVSFRVRPILIEMAISEVTDVVSITVNEAIAAKVTDGSINYSDLITFEKDSDGRITALITDMAKTNALKAEISNEITLRLSDRDMTRIVIPVGDFFGSTLLSGRGPSIEVNIVSVTNVDTSFSNKFSSAGINQTRHQIMLNITVDLTILVPLSSRAVHVPVEMCVAETVIVGEVPYSYANLEGKQ